MSILQSRAVVARRFRVSDKQVWQVDSRPEQGTWGSMVHAGGRLYVTGRNGTTFVFLLLSYQFGL